MAAALSEDSLVKKLMGVLNTQDSVQTMSLWILHHKANHEQIVEIWLKVLKKAKIPHRLTMYYVANDVVQNCKKKHAVMFLSAFQSVLRDATVFVRDSSIKVKIERILKIWEERGVFESDFVEELRAILSKTKSLPAVDAKILADFKPTQLIESIVNYKRLESEAELRQKQVASLRVDATNAEILKQLKDRSGGKLFVQEFEDSGKKLESFVEALTNEIAQESAMLEQLEQSQIFYDTQYSEAKIVANYILAAGPVRQAAAARYIPRPVPPPVVVKVDEGYSKKKDDIFSISPVPSPPSPDGSPDGLSLSPRHKSVAELTKELTSGTNKGSLSLESKLQSFLNNSIAGSTNQTTIVDANADLPQGPKPTSQYVEKTSSPSPSAEDQPDWLTEMALAEMDWSGDPDKAGSTPVSNLSNQLYKVRDEPEVVEEKTETAKNPIDFLTRIVNTAKTKPVGMTTSFLDNLQMLTSASKREQQQQQHAGDAMSPATVAANGKAPPLVGKMPSPPKVPPPSLPPANHPVSPAPAPAARTGSPDRAQPLDVYSLSQPPPPPPSNTTHGDAGFAAERGVAPANAFGSFMASFAAAATAPPASAAYSTSQFPTSAGAEAVHAGTEQGSAPMLRPTYSEQGSAPMLRPTYSEQGGGPPHLSNIAANSSGGPPAPQEPALSSPPPHYRQIGRYDDGGYADRYPSDNRNRYNHRPAADRYDQYRDYSAHAREPQWQQSYRSEHPYQRNDPYRPPPPKRYPPPPPSHPHQAFY
ncbi:PREDICTED: regulation of nuclear pre-mRNA domain-containing protein 2-like [Priapulus caudatus]|uniref:Regulation of nuclear pre-mRNA domain-containing protein 2-like n=1 Tax=Priapulus caudatus TaxID=37621 RepID=A0ABM1EI29_PRICU|nr:PREDICTED: regulation of nuclear pre-mRNA domain-containing protein 2-like [Priapulus caudatus]